MSSRKRRAFEYLPLAALLPLAWYVYSGSRHAGIVAAENRQTNSEIIARSKELCAKLDLPVSTLKFSLEKSAILSVNGPTERHWVVDGVDRQGIVEARVILNADNGSLHTLERIMARPSAGEPAIETDEAAKRTSWQWISRLGIDKQSGSWQVWGAPRLFGHRWMVRWKGKYVIASIVIEDAHGELASASCLPTNRVGPTAMPMTTSSIAL